jgi:hypothetical protein
MRIHGLACNCGENGRVSVSFSSCKASKARVRDRGTKSVPGKVSDSHVYKRTRPPPALCLSPFLHLMTEYPTDDIEAIAHFLASRRPCPANLVDSFSSKNLFENWVRDSAGTSFASETGATERPPSFNPLTPNTPSSLQSAMSRNSRQYQDPNYYHQTPTPHYIQQPQQYTPQIQPVLNTYNEHCQQGILLYLKG